jgi:hypothetical protein
VRIYENRALHALVNGPEGFGTGPRVGEALTVARWMGERSGAVLMLLLRRDGVWDGTTVHFERSSGDQWEPSIEAGGGWPDPFDRPLDGWDGQHIDWFGSSGTNEVRVFRGQVSGNAAKLVLDPTGAAQELEIDAVTGAYLAGNEGTNHLRLVAYNANGDSIDEAEIAPPGW